MMKKLLLCAALGAASITTQTKDATEVWSVKVTVSYMKEDGQLVTNLPVMNFSVPVGQCGTVITRSYKFKNIEEPRTQKVCIEKNGNITKTSGWLMTKELIPDVMLPDDTGTRKSVDSLDFGKEFDIRTDGNYISTNVIPYNVEIRRLNRAAATSSVKPGK